MRSKVLSLCSGYGGLEMGLELAGVDVDLVAYAEFDKYASKVMEAHHPGVKNLGDIKAIRWDRTGLTPIDILTAGYPCQPFSQAGKRLGTDDPRHLWPYVAQAVRHLRPRHVFLENVRGHVTKGLKEVLADLADIGYVGSWRCVRASDVGACHRRERVFIVARAANSGSPGLEGSQPAERHVVSAGCAGVVTNPTSDTGGICHRDGLPAADSGGGELQRRGVGRLVPCSQGTTEGNQAERQRDGHPPRDGGETVTHPSHVGRQRDGEPRGRWCGSPHHRVGVDWGKFEPAIRRWEHVLGRSAPAPTEGDKHRLNPVFVEWMMGLPAGWVTGVDGISRTQQLKILGNGVVPQQAAYASTLMAPHVEEVTAAVHNL